MEFKYKVKKRYPRNKLNNDYSCEIRTRAPGANILLIIGSWHKNVHMSMNGGATLQLLNFIDFEQAVLEGMKLINERQQNG